VNLAKCVGAVTPLVNRHHQPAFAIDPIPAHVPRAVSMQEQSRRHPATTALDELALATRKELQESMVRALKD
jgi:hypothetical protein